jgi:hypothetical protein
MIEAIYRFGASDEWRSLAFLLTGGRVADCTAGSASLRQMPTARILHGDKRRMDRKAAKSIGANSSYPARDHAGSLSRCQHPPSVA